MSSGKQAIDAALQRLYGKDSAFRYGGQGPAPLAQVTIHRCDDHWHYVSYGLSQLEDETDEEYTPAGYDTPEAGKSGWGFELTFRLAAEGAEPPVWPVGLLMWLAGYVKETRNPFAAHHTMDMEASADPETPDASLTAIVTMRDPTLEPLHTPHGEVELLQVVGITRDELEAARSWSAERFLEVLTACHPLGVSRLTRPSILDDPEARARVEAGIERDGSSQAACYTQIHWSRSPDCSVAQLDLTPDGAAAVVRMLRGRSAHGREFFLFAESQGAVFERGDAPGFEEPSPAMLRVTLDDAVTQELIADLKPTPGSYAWGRLPGFTVRVLEPDVVPGASE